MIMEENRNLLILKTERENARMNLVSQISSIRYTLDNLESKLNGDGQQYLYISDGLQGNGSSIDKYLAQLTTYDRAIELLIRELSKDT